MSSLIALVGPTAVGKTEISIKLAKRLDAEIVGCDSMQVYRCMSRLTTQPTSEQRAEVPHHLMDCMEPTEAYNVGQYRRMALQTIETIHRRGKAVLLVGGTGLYLKALTDGLCDAPPADDGVRTKLWQAVQEQGSEVCHWRLAQVDPETASKLHPHDARRIVRALEVYEVTGEPLSQFWHRTNGRALEITIIGLNRDRRELYERINRRVERMIRDDGVLEEAKQVLALSLSPTARQVHGLRFLEAYLNGECSLNETIAQWQQQVRNYAKRQLTWFRAEPRIRWITITAEEQSDSIAERILNTEPLCHSAT